MTHLLRHEPRRDRRESRITSLLSLFRLVLLFLAASSAFGQSDTGRILGSVKDVTGAVIPNTSVQITSVDTGRTITVSTGGAGEFVANALQAGKYHIEVKQTGFKTATADLSLEVSQIRELALVLQTGGAEISVNVTDAVPLIDTSTSSTGEVIQGRQVTELPLNGRNFSQLALLTPGVTRGAYGDNASGGSSGTSVETFRNSETGGASLAVNGLRPQANNFILDGVDNNEGGSVDILDSWGIWERRQG